LLPALHRAPTVVRPSADRPGSAKARLTWLFPSLLWIVAISVRRESHLRRAQDDAPSALAAGPIAVPTDAAVIGFALGAATFLDVLAESLRSGNDLVG
jgi:hypothetical protein